MVILKLSCKKHANYTGQRKPQRECPACWNLFEAINDLIMDLQSDKEELKAIGLIWEILYQ